MTNRTTLLKLVQAHIERHDDVVFIDRYYTRVKFRTDETTLGVPSDLMRTFADANGRLVGGSGNKYTVRVSKQE